MSTNLTTNLNMLSPGNFKVMIDSSEFANVQFFCTSANVPALTQSEVQQGYGNRTAYVPGDTMEFGTFEVTFIVDEEMKNYIEMHDWLKKNADYNINETKTTKFNHEEKVKDITLSIQTNKNTINKQIRFMDAFPTSLGELAFTTQDTAVEYITCTVSFRYNRFEFVR
tara:strand:+ start:7896 stop:8399 length:504 start_codon:yes stop_codon:yes gene_type:complete